MEEGPVTGWRIAGLTVAASAAVIVYAAWPRKADLRAFDPAGTGQFETAMWRDYYEKRYPRLFYHLYESSRTQFGFSPLDSVRIALAAAQAAKTFQPTRSRQEAAAALPHLVVYYSLLRGAAPAAFDVQQAANLELDWWQARREAVPAQDYGITVARVAALTYGMSAEASAMQAYGIGRAQAMAYRDARGAGITDADWSNIESQLREAYQQLRLAIGPPA
jgi:hypothetical protein